MAICLSDARGRTRCVTNERLPRRAAHLCPCVRISPVAPALLSRSTTAHMAAHDPWKTSGSAWIQGARSLRSILRAECRTSPPGDVCRGEPEKDHQDQEASAGCTPRSGRAAPERGVLERRTVRGSPVRVETLPQRIDVENSVAIRVVTLAGGRGQGSGPWGFGERREAARDKVLPERLDHRAGSPRVRGVTDGTGGRRGELEVAGDRRREVGRGS